MRSICFYFQVHQPFRLRTYRFFDIGENHYYYNDFENSHILRRIAQRSYLPMNDLLLKLMKKHGKAFKVTFSITGTALEQFQAYAPEVIESFQRLAATGNVEFLAETYAHSLASVKSKTEFRKQVELHSKKIEELFGQKPTVFRNTELIYSDEIGEMVYDLGYNTMLTEGARHILGWKSPNYMYCNARNPKLKVLLKNYRLSDDIAFRFSHHGWPEWPLTADKFVGWLNDVDAKEEVVNLFMDYETFGEHQWKETGIFDFMSALPGKVLKDSPYKFATPSELGSTMQPVSAIHVQHRFHGPTKNAILPPGLAMKCRTKPSTTFISLRKRSQNAAILKFRKTGTICKTATIFTTCAPNGFLTVMCINILIRIIHLTRHLSTT
jgi:alpha-amylase